MVFLFDLSSFESESSVQKKARRIIRRRRRLVARGVLREDDDDATKAFRVLQKEREREREREKIKLCILFIILFPFWDSLKRPRKREIRTPRTKRRGLFVMGWADDAQELDDSMLPSYARDDADGDKGKREEAKKGLRDARRNRNRSRRC